MRYFRNLFTLILFGDAYAFPNVPATSTGSAQATRSTITTSSMLKPSLILTTKSTEPCAIASSASLQWEIANPSSSAVSIDAEIAYQCLQSIPIVKSDALRLVGGLATYFGFQSTLGFLKNPPHGYLFPGVDLLSGIARIEGKLREDAYDGEYDFQADIYELATSVHDGHFQWRPDAFATVFNFGTGLSAASISRDGLDIPQIYISSDNFGQGNITVPSRVVSINGQDPTTFLQTWSARASSEQDPDALYNKLFSGVARNLVNDPSTFSRTHLYPGPFTTLTFENGTTRRHRNIARVVKNLEGVISGQSFYSKFCQATTSVSAKETPTSQSTVPFPTGYPRPLIRQSSNLVAGYLLESPRNQDVAVLAVSSFETNSEILAQEYQEVVETFFSKAKALGKKKVIIDLQSNDGGTVYQGLDFFGQLFPHIVPYNAANLRATPGLDLLGQGVSDLVKKNLVPETDADLSTLISSAASLAWNAGHDLKANGLSAYESWSKFFGPRVTSHDNLTNLFRENLTDPLNSVGIVITGTSNRTTFTQPFAAEDIILLYDGICASTCAVFSELLKTQAGVRSVAVGGRPQYGPMQGVGATKGSRIYGYDLVLDGFGLAYAHGSKEYQLKVNQSAFKNIDYPLQRTPGAKFNSYNNIRLGDNSLTPLQFVYEAANCRMFYTWEMLTDITVLWDRVADVAFRSPNFSSPYCVKDSTGHPSAAPNVTDYDSYDVPPGARCQYCGGSSAVNKQEGSHTVNVTHHETTTTSSYTPSSASSTLNRCSLTLLLTTCFAMFWV